MSRVGRVGITGMVALIAILFTGYLTSCATGPNSNVHVGIGGRSQTGDGAMEAPSDVEVRDLVGDIPITGTPGIDIPDFGGDGDDPGSPGDGGSGNGGGEQPEPPPPPITDPSRQGDQTFLWKPVSESDGKLVILMPAAYNGVTKSVLVDDERGEYRSTANGNRGHYRFDDPGSNYGKNIPITIVLADDSVQRITVPNGAQRHQDKTLKPPPSVNPPPPDPPEEPDDPDTPDEPADPEDTSWIEKETGLAVRGNLLHIDPRLNIVYKVDRQKAPWPTKTLPSWTVHGRGSHVAQVPYEQSVMFYQLNEVKGPPHGMTLWGSFQGWEVGSSEISLQQRYRLPARPVRHQPVETRA